MGTQSSYRGPGDTTPLLPDWALQPIPAVQEEDANEGDIAADDSSNAEPVEEVTDAPISQAKPVGVWKSAKMALGKCVSNGNRTDSFRKAARKYVKALGGSTRAARTSVAGRNATASLASFLSGVSQQGIDSTLRAFKLGTFIGQDPEAVFSAVINAICPDGASREDIAARDGVSDALWQLYADLVIANGGIDAINSLTAEQITSTLQTSIVTYIFRRWLGDLGIKIEQKALTSKDAVKLEKQMRVYIRDSVTIEFESTDPLKIDWKGREGRQIIEQIYRNAYSVFGGLS